MNKPGENVLRDMLDSYTNTFISRCFAVLQIVSGLMILFAINWKIALGLVLFAWGHALQKSLEPK